MSGLIQVHVVSIDDVRWEGCAENIAAFGMEPVKVDGVHESEAPQHLVDRMTMKDARKKVAIRIAMRNAVIISGGGIIVQDDTRFSFRPEWDGRELVTFAAPRDLDHHCPRAFAVPTDLVEDLAHAWTDGRQNACGGWRPVINFRLVVRPSIVEVT